MQTDLAGYQKQVTRRRAAEMLADEFGGPNHDHKAIEQAEAFLEREELDSGIVVSRAGKVEFWHRTFQEYLCARAIAARSDAGLEQILWGPPPRLYLPEWREVMALLAGVLQQQGEDKVDNLVRTMLKKLGDKPSLADEARCAGLLGVMLRDLAPVHYKPPGPEYEALKKRVMAIFDREQSVSVPIETRIAAADAMGQAGDTRLDFLRDDYWVAIPTGKFLMGAQPKDSKKPNFDGEAIQRESPVHEVLLDAYEIAKYPITVGQYLYFVEDNGYGTDQHWEAGGFGEYGIAPVGWDEQLLHPSRPVTGVSWHEAVAFCVWAGMRLPAEAEWERAARGTTGRKFPWGNESIDGMRANFAPNFRPDVGHASPVGIYPLGSTPEGICDLAGNVWGWCQDWWDEKFYSKSPGENPIGPMKATGRVIRGGSWGNNASNCRSAHRSGYGPGLRSNYLGFRVARSSVQ
jgi:formylglycine-generating enzyme required for sulfatase activity